MLCQTILEKAVELLNPVWHADSKDRILGALDIAWMTLYPPRERTAEQHSAITAACKELTKEIAKTRLKRDVKEEDADFFLTCLGAEISFEDLSGLLNETLGRIRIQTKVAAA